MTIVQLATSLNADDYRLEHGRFPLEIGPLRFVDDSAADADWLVATYDIKHAIATRVPRERRIMLQTEPDVDLAPDYLNQFGILVSPQPMTGFTGIWHQGHGALPNRFARDVTKPGFASAYTYEELVALEPPDKRNAVAVVFSRKSILPGHRRRQRFVRRLKAVLGDRLDVFGDGYVKIGLKADAILPYKYHLALENTVMPSYWTEKVADAFLGFALPFVSGAPDLARWFPEDSFVPIDLSNVDQAVETVVSTMNRDIHADRLPAIREARRRVIQDERSARSLPASSLRTRTMRRALTMRRRSCRRRSARRRRASCARYGASPGGSTWCCGRSEPRPKRLRRRSSGRTSCPGRTARESGGDSRARRKAHRALHRLDCAPPRSSGPASGRSRRPAGLAIHLPRRRRS